jgi:hypothetical protein
LKKSVLKFLFLMFFSTSLYFCQSFEYQSLLIPDQFKKNANSCVLNSSNLTTTFFNLKRNPFMQNRKERNFPINFTYPRTQRIMINVGIPEEYTIEYMLQKIALALPEKLVYFDIILNNHLMESFKLSFKKKLIYLYLHQIFIRL